MVVSCLVVGRLQTTELAVIRFVVLTREVFLENYIQLDTAFLFTIFLLKHFIGL